MVKIYTVDDPFRGKTPDRSTLVSRARSWDASETIDRVLIGYSSIWSSNMATAGYLFAQTERVGLIVAHRPGVMHPAAAARFFGTLDRLCGGRLALNIVTGSSDKDMAREGDYEIKARRYDRASEYVQLMNRAWREQDAFDFQGDYYRADGVRHMLRPESAHLPIFMGGDSDDAVKFGAQLADIYMLWGEPLKGTQERIERVGAAAAEHGRKPEFSLSLRLFLGETDEEAWAKANAVATTIEQAQGSGRFLRSSSGDTSVGRQRQLEVAKTEKHDDCFWSRLVSLLGGFANSAALVGTPDRVLDSLKAYRDLGIESFLLTTGADGLWEPELEGFLQRVKREL
ncbi:LLM class flavin-dependent oxidoreductase [Caballeronia sp. LP003]|uniref:LLM class flavin-dependent oxidoreductase n=1 Tax=Caballeronia sp. LP003 TaxID=3038551 RepID=UPI0028588C34|nr:LLM class flavin-dependent oxidoreductase [Caballeronia sp. LP003]MDR5785524.1 LLM class flavin-dependent oxidoreductase [Caballeronia sp. LP003]